MNKPSWASFATTTGALTGTPTSANVGTSAAITISVSDGTAGASLAAFTIKVGAASSSGGLSIAGTPAATATVGSAYSFTPTASDVAGSTLAFSIQGQPTWANFNKASGMLSGTPGSANVGTDPDIVISVTDGTASVSLAAFSITVAQASVGTGSASLSWTVPTENSDGSAATNLSGFNVYYGTDSGNLSHKVAIPSIADTSQVVSGLASGTWYFAVTTVNSTGLESNPTNAVSATID